MSKKPLSDMTAQQFVAIVGALGGRSDHVASALGRSRATVSLYANGHQPIPVDTVTKLRELLTTRAAKIKAAGHQLRAADESALVSQMIIASNEIRRREPDRLPSLKRRDKPEDSRVYPAYRMHHARFNLYAEALAVYHAACMDRRRQATDPRDIRAYDRELADLRVIVGNTSGIASKGAPYDMMITHSEWFVVSRALRHETNDAKYSLYQHWRHHKGAGYPRA